MELRVGMYIITNDRMKIGQIKGFCTCEMCEKRGFYEPIINGDIIITDYDKSQGFHGYKFYDNPIDLIEVGDYVNGYRVYSGGENHFDYILTWDEESDYYMKIELPSVDIKSIVTKEQFKNMEYEVE